MKIMMLIQYVEKKENRSSKGYEMSKWSFGDATLMTEWNTAHWHCYIDMTHKYQRWTYTFSKFSNQGTNL